MAIEARFAGGLAVDTNVRGYTVRTDQPIREGGEGVAPTALDLFLASIPACAGYFALRFCRERSIPPDGLSIAMDTETDPATGLVTQIRIRLTPPEALPEVYRPALLKAVDECTVKRQLADPPRIETVLVGAGQLVTA